MAPSKEPSIFVKWLTGITSVLVVAGITGIIALEFRTTAQLARISVILESQSSEIADAQIAVKALELLVVRINNNHSSLKAELEDLQRRLGDVEHQFNP